MAIIFEFYVVLHVRCNSTTCYAWALTRTISRALRQREQQHTLAVVTVTALISSTLLPLPAMPCEVLPVLLLVLVPITKKIRCSCGLRGTSLPLTDLETDRATSRFTLLIPRLSSVTAGCQAAAAVVPVKGYEGRSERNFDCALLGVFSLWFLFPFWFQITM
jgi:hypothetical protein